MAFLREMGLRTGDAIVAIMGDETMTPRKMMAGLELMEQQLENNDANVLGVVFNKRQYHVPNWIYNRV